MDGIATKCYFFKWVLLLWHFKANEYLIAKCKWQVFQILIINWQKFDVSRIAPPYFSALMQNGHFWPFSLIHSKGLEKSETMFLLFWKILYFKILTIFKPPRKKLKIIYKKDINEITIITYCFFRVDLLCVNLYTLVLLWCCPRNKWRNPLFQSQEVNVETLFGVWNSHVLFVLSA